MLCATILRPLAWTTDFFAERRKMDFNRYMPMTPIFSQNECFVQPFYDHWPKLQTFSQKGEQWTSVDLCEWVQYLAKTYALCSHLTACGPNLRLFRTMLKNGLKSIYANEANIYQKRMLCATILRDVAQTSDFFAEWRSRRKLDWNRSMRMSPIFCQNRCFV